MFHGRGCSPGSGLVDQASVSTGHAADAPPIGAFLLLIVVQSVKHRPHSRQLRSRISFLNRELARLQFPTSRPPSTNTNRREVAEHEFQNLPERGPADILALNARNLSL